MIRARVASLALLVALLLVSAPRNARAQGALGGAIAGTTAAGTGTSDAAAKAPHGVAEVPFKPEGYPDILDSGEVAYGTGKPATSLKITDTMTYKPARSSWFLRGDANLDVPVSGLGGAGIAVGYLSRWVFVDAGFGLYVGRYGAVRVTQSGSFDPASQVAAPRSNADTASLWTLGPGIGTMFKLSDNWTAVSRFGLSYLQYQDTTNSISFRGGLAAFHAEAAYRVNSILSLAPGMTYNVGYVDASNAAASAPHDNFLPLQWWAWNLGIYVWF